jgi:hypothetical protein
VNERISLLAEQAFTAVGTTHDSITHWDQSVLDKNDTITVYTFTQGTMEKFAELIVRQCVKSTIALQNTAIDNEWGLDETFHIIVDDMVEQFDMQHIFRS